MSGPTQVLQAQQHFFPEFTPNRPNTSISPVNQNISSIFQSSALQNVNVFSNGEKTGEVFRYSTLGDGSCGFHALLGTENDEGMLECDAGMERAIFAVEIRKQYDAGSLDSTIKEELKDIFLHHDRAPGEMKFDASIQDEWKEQLDLYNEILNSPEIDDNVRQEILNDIVDQFIDTAIVSYLYHLVDTESSITPNELSALATTKDKTVHLYTKMRNEGVCGEAEIFNPGNHQIEIFLSDTGYHYERARFIPHTYG